MKVRAVISFAGAFSMGRGEVRECSDKAILSDLLQAGYVEEVKEEQKPEKSEESEKPKKGVKSNGNK